MAWTFRGSSPGGGRDFPHLSRPAVGPTQSPILWVPGSFPGVKRPGRGVDNRNPSKAEDKNVYSCTSVPHLDLRVLL